MGSATPDRHIFNSVRNFFSNIGKAPRDAEISFTSIYVSYSTGNIDADPDVPSYLQQVSQGQLRTSHKKSAPINFKDARNAFTGFDNNAPITTSSK